MELIDFPYTTTSGLKKYSKLITKAIALFNQTRSPAVGIIAHEFDYGSHLKEEDRLEYWDKESNIVNYGRYLLFINTKGEHIKFWTGLRLTQTKKDDAGNLLPGEITFIIWFKKDDLHIFYHEKIKNSLPYAVFDNEIWIPMKSTDFEKFFDSCSCCIRQTVINFWHSVLEKLKD